MKHYRFDSGNAEMKKTCPPSSSFSYVVLSAILATSSAAALAAPPDPPPPPRVIPAQPVWLPTQHEWKWELKALDGGIASFHVEVVKGPMGGPKPESFEPDPFKFAFEAGEGDLLGGNGYSWQVPGKTPNDNQYTGPDSTFSFSVRSAGFKGQEKFSYRYDYLWEYDEDGKTKDMRTVFSLNELGQAVILQTSLVPEPEEYAMMIAGLTLIGAIRRRRNEAASA